MNQAVSSRKIVVVGGSCVGKTTFCRRLSQLTDIRHIELDSLIWEAGWKEAKLEVFRDRVRKEVSKESWIVDGNYNAKIKDIVWDECDTIIWLHLSLAETLRRFFLRSFRRSFRREVLWNGCRETLRNSIFRRDSLLIWILQTHRGRTETYEKLLASPPDGIRMLKLVGSTEVEEFFQNLNAIRKTEG